MISAVVFAAISGTLVAARSSTVVPLMLPAVDPQNLVASVVDASPAITTFAVECADETKDGPECGLLHARTVAQGPSTWSMHYSYSNPEYGSYEQDMRCNIDRAENSIDCEVSMVEEYDGTTGTTTTSVSTHGLRQLFVPVTVTAGLDKLDAAPASTEEIAPATATDDVETDIFSAPFRPQTTNTNESDAETTTEADGETSTQEETQRTSSGATSTFSTTTSTPTTTPTTTPGADESDNAAFPRATQNVILAGAAAIVGGVMML